MFKLGVRIVQKEKRYNRTGAKKESNPLRERTFKANRVRPGGNLFEKNIVLLDRAYPQNPSIPQDPTRYKFWAFEIYSYAACQLRPTEA